MSERQEIVRSTRGPSIFGTLGYILFGPILWALQLVAVYAGHALICTTGMADGIARPMVLAVTILLALVLLAFLAVHERAARMLGLADDTSGRRTYDWLSRWIGYLAIVAILWTGGAALVVGACVQGR